MTERKTREQIYERRKELARRVLMDYRDGFNRFEIMEEYQISQPTFYRLLLEFHGGLTRHDKVAHLSNRIDRIDNGEIEC
jgi:hypothetical protein